MKTEEFEENFPSGVFICSNLKTKKRKRKEIECFAWKKVNCRKISRTIDYVALNPLN